ncbi:class I SAM-dependent methyltransferase [Microbispora sp. RL4-1S]|uniref:Class I SAM-dependent methyltransferase n=1 Tax=Microbispora oryzae TaxID=2806554 RepID=A0A940WWQ2_9ACTN|nr:daptide-type RiPP biosynthesis methyltransferase [Microbispora oryzae]MBP2708354.1 class I SAM-dependent methyltransferase [Microbispora oryzae]
MTETTLPRIPGRAGQVVAELGERVTLHDLYDHIGVPIYHDLAAGDSSEIRELLTIVRRIPGQVLELAAGSGRLTLPLLALGRHVTALELSEDMLGLLRARLLLTAAGMSERCTPVQADMSAFALGRSFPLIVLGTTSISLLDEAGRAGLYRSVGAHLEPGGRFVLSTVDIPADGADGSDLDFETVGVSGRKYRMFEHWPVGSSVRSVTIVPETADPEPITVCTTTIGVLPADLVEQELADAGFMVRARTPLPVPGVRHTDVFLEAEAL